MKSRWYLWPFAWLYGVVVYVRNRFFDWGWITSRQYKTAVISVGNITIGGTGKTPHVAYIMDLLTRSFQVAMVSRGYKRKSRGLQVATPMSNSRQLGDEPFQLYRKFPYALIIAESNRRKAIEYIEKNYPSNEVVVLDDAFQHRYVEPGLSILLVDYHRLITKDKLLPVGNLRESASSRYRASVVIITKCPAKLAPIELRNLYNEIAPRPYQRLFYSFYEYAPFTSLFGNEIQVLTNTMAVLAVSGIAQPKDMLQYLSSQAATVVAMSYDDHHDFTSANWKNIQRKFDELPYQDKCIVVTEKDAAKLIGMSKDIPSVLHEKIWVLPIQVNFLQNGSSEFDKLILDYVSKNKRNSDFFGR